MTAPEPRPSAIRRTPDRPGPVAAGGPAAAAPLRLTWVQPEDLVGHELRQAEQDGRDAAAPRRRWLRAGGALAPDRAGASPAPADPRLRTLASALLDELAALPRPSAAWEPTELSAVIAECPRWPSAGPAHEDRTATVHPAPPVDHGDLEDRLHAAWLGRAAGCVLGKPVEKLPLEGIRALARATGNWPVDGWFTQVGLDPATARRWPWNRRSAGNSLAENIVGAPEDDDLNYPLVNLLLLQRYGHGFSTAQVAQVWLDELPAGRTFTAERVAYRNLLSGVEPPDTARHHNPFREWIGAQIRADVFGWTHPGDPAAAAEAAYRDAVLTHTGNGVYAAMFVAAALATAVGGGGDVQDCLRAGLSVVPERSRLAQAVRRGIAEALSAPSGGPEGFASVVDRLHASYRDYHWVHALPNVALLAAALTHADGDFHGSICRVVSGGLDTDSNGATAGSLTGALAGSPTALPVRWTAPLANRLATSVAGLDGVGFDVLARRTAALAVHRPTVPSPSPRQELPPS